MTVASASPPRPPDCEHVAHLENRIRRELHAVAYPCVRQVGCIVRGGVLILRGRLPSYYLKQVAQTVVRPHLAPAMVIDNQISVGRMGDSPVPYR